ncbi:hypothetical protein McanCB56680_001823 [Microsporum canis]
MAMQKIALVGANGKLGPAVLDELLASGKFQLAGARDLRGNKITVPECELPCIRCLVVPSLKLWTHKLCFDLLRGSYKSNKPTLDDLRKFGDAVKPLYKPLDRENIDIASSWEGLFSCHTRTIIESSFRLNLLKSLPVEIQIMISDFIGPCWYLIVLGETRRLIEVLRNPRKSQCERLSLTKEVYITRITYQGNSYITNISNIPLESQSLDTSTQECLKLPTQVKSLIISTDHIGVRRLQFVDGTSHPSADESPWYEIIKLPGSCQELQVINDGLFIRNMRVPQDKVYDVTRTWSSPYPPKFEPWNTYRVDKGRRLDYVKLDDNSIQGLLVCCSRVTNGGFYAFSNTSRPFKKFVISMTQRIKKTPIFWIFFPINTGESIEAAWVRRLKDCHGRSSNPILVIQTTYGRTATFGPHPPAELRELYEFHPLVKENDGVISGIFHNGLDPECEQISEFGVTCNKNHRVRATMPQPPIEKYDAPSIPSRGGSPAMTWYLTKAPLEGLLRNRLGKFGGTGMFRMKPFLLSASGGAMLTARATLKTFKEALIALGLMNEATNGKNYHKPELLSGGLVIWVML